jgi:hypothetical protein
LYTGAFGTVTLDAATHILPKAAQNSGKKNSSPISNVIKSFAGNFAGAAGT